MCIRDSDDDDDDDNDDDDDDADESLMIMIPDSRFTAYTYRSNHEHHQCK